jgi:hypothetical protein
MARRGHYSWKSSSDGPSRDARSSTAGVSMTRAYHDARGDTGRTEILVPDAAHGTNPASAVMCGYSVREIPTDDEGDVELDALREAVGPHTAGIMLTNPSTLGVFERRIVVAFLEAPARIEAHGEVVVAGALGEGALAASVLLPDGEFGQRFVVVLAEDALGRPVLEFGLFESARTGERTPEATERAERPGHVRDDAESRVGADEGCIGSDEVGIGPDEPWRLGPDKVRVGPDKSIRPYRRSLRSDEPLWTEQRGIRGCHATARGAARKE